MLYRRVRVSRRRRRRTATSARPARFDRKRKDKKVSNQDWQSETDPDSRITKMKDGRTHLSH
ncbi:MAG: hypothetical protein MI757_20640, partial [Pirellulales bacterium]|nr:hypothetical protein [Pirellulales bacterium]